VCRAGAVIAFQHIAQERYDFCHARAKSDGHRREIERAGRAGRPRASHAGVREYCEARGVALESITPLTHFLTHGLVYRTGMDAAAIEAFSQEFRARLREPAVYEFVRWFERSIVPQLPQEYSEMMIVVLRKP
jgi:hypothetical protein